MPTRPSRLRRALCAALPLFLHAATLHAQTPAKSPTQGRIRVEVNLVNILTTVLDAHGKPAADLPRDAFEVYEEGVKQKLEIFEPETQQPLDLALMIDTSLSTLKELAFEKEAAAHFIRQVLRPGDRMSVFEFSDTVTQLTGFVSEVRQLETAARSIEPGAGTVMYDAVFLGARALGRAGQGRRRVIVMVTDAGESTSQYDFEDARRAALQYDVLLYTVLIRPVKNESGRNTAGENALITIADSTGGAMYVPDEVTEMDKMFERISLELRTQYRLGYYPPPQRKDGGFRRIEVRVQGDYRVRHRSGYYLPEPFD